MLEEIVSIVRQAGQMVLNARDIAESTHEKSNVSDLVTKYDVAIQAFLKEKLTALLPEADFFGEEGEKGARARPWRFIVDPIDGTVNFVRSLHYSNIAVALAKNEKVMYGVVYNPYLDEMFAAERGKGAFLNGRPIHVSNNDMTHGITLCGSTIYDRSYTDRSFSIMRRLYDLGMDYRRFAAAELDFCQVAAGRCEVFFECRLSPWDIAAGSLLVEEAGGCVTQLDGSPLDISRPCSVFATNGRCHSVLALLQE